MANEIQALGLQPSQTTFYAIVVNPANGQLWNTSTVAFEAYNSANVANYAIALTDANGIGFYVANFPTGITAIQDYPVLIYQQVTSGTSAGPGTDTLVSGSGIVKWGGTAVRVPVATSSAGVASANMTQIAGQTANAAAAVTFPATIPSLAQIQAGLPTDASIQSDVTTADGSTLTTIGTNVSAIETVTNLLNGMLDSTGGEQFTAHALANAPSGGGGVTDTSVQADVVAALTAQGFTTARATELDTIEGHAANADSQSATAVSDLTADATTLSTINTNVSAVETVTNELGTMIDTTGGDQFNTHALANAPTGGGGGSVTDSSVQADVTAALTAQGLTTGRATELDTIEGHAANADSQSATADTNLATLITNVNTAISDISGVPAALLATNIDGSMKLQDVLALQESIIAGRYVNTPAPSGGGTQTTVYYRADNATVLATDTVAINSSGAATARSVTFSNLP